MLQPPTRWTDSQGVFALAEEKVVQHHRLLTAVTRDSKFIFATDRFATHFVLLPPYRITAIIR